jgi:hypothetical protein
MTSLKNQTVCRRWINQSLREAGWAPLLVFAVHVIALGVFDPYGRIAHLDLFMHFIGGAGMAFFLHRTSINASLIGVIGPLHPITHRLLVFTATCAVALFWEFAEFILDQTLGTHSQAGLDDTLGDLLFGVIGASSFTLSSFAFVRYPRLSLAGIIQRLQNTKDAVPGD